MSNAILPLSYNFTHLINIKNLLLIWQEGEGQGHTDLHMCLRDNIQGEIVPVIQSKEDSGIYNLQKVALDCWIKIINQISLASYWTCLINQYIINLS